MPNWKKVIVSGSDAILNEVTASSGLDTTDVTIDDWGSISASLASIEAGGASQTLQDVTDNGSTTTNNITIDSTGDARLVLDRAANSNDSEIEFKTDGTTNWSIGTGQVGSDAEFTIKGGSSNFVRINQSGQADFLSAVTSSDVTIDDWGSISASLASIEAGGASQTLQQVTDNGNSTTNKIIVQGVDIGRGNNTAASSVAIGDDALKSNTTNGVSNTAIGDAALEFTTTGQSNTAVGHQAAEGNTTGFFNVAVGAASLFSNQKGRYNIAIGTNAGSYVHTSNLGNSAPTSSIFIGANTKASIGSNENQIVIGYEASGSGNNTVTIGNSSITNNYFSGDISGSDVTIDDWGSVSASLASLNSEANSVTLQEVLNASNGEATASGSIYLTSSAASLDFEYTVLHAGTVVAEGGSGLFSRPNTSAPSSHFTTALTMNSPHSASVASSLKSQTGFSTDYRGQRRQLFPQDYVSAASQSMYVEYAEGANQENQGVAYFQVDLDTKSPEYLLPLTASRLYVRAGESSSPPPLTVEENIVISSSGTHGGTLSFSDLTHMASDKNTINSGGSTAIQTYSLASFIGVKLDYVVYLGARDGGSNITHRAGTFMATWDEPGNISYSETTTTDNQSGVGIPSTSGFSIFAEVGVGSTAQISIENTTGYTATLISQTTAFRAPY